MLGGAAAIVALLVYALWPEPTPQSQFVDEPVQHQESIAPAEPLTPTPSVIPDVAETVPVSPEPAAESNKALEASVTSLSGRQDNSDKRIDALEARIKALEQMPRPPVSPAAPVRKATSHKPVARSTPARTTTAHRSGVTGWRINSVYPGMAWLSDGKSTWAVYPGDTLNGMRIDAIDATRREVRTSRGVIRQGD
ncbi:UNVERIFIED_ORG: FtsZ-interacting cell division protein ZipA [Buttiauxella agrestis ATCC 33320]